jgi:hypothetical protein
MARIRKARSDDSLAPKSLIASAKRVATNKDPARTARSGSGWQDAAWHFYDTVGEYAYAVNWVGNLLSRAKLYATYDDGDGPQRLPSDHYASRLVDALFYDEQGRSTALQQIGVHYTVAGEAYIVGYEDEDGVEQWEVMAPSRVTSNSDGSWNIDGKTMAKDDAVVLRIWRPHPVARKQATSPSRAALPILSEIERLTMHVAAQVDSRLASAGILFLPNQMAFAVKDENGVTVTGNADAFVEVLQDVMGRAINNREDASALVPIVVTADGEVIENVNHLQFWSELDNHAIELRTEAIRRLALSMDMPPEILTGQGDSNHWSSWSIDESSIKSHTEPLLNRIADDLATGYLRPLLQEGAEPDEDGALSDDERPMAPEEARKYGIGVDTAEMRLRPNRSSEALELWDRGVLAAQALLEETGFRAEQAQDADEHRQWFLDKVASGQTTPEIVEAALRALGVDLEVREDPDAPEDRPEIHEQRPTPSLEDHPRQEIPDTQEAAMLAACEVLVFRALERAGNRLKNKIQRKIPGVAAAETYLFHRVDTGTLDFVLEDAWSAVERFAPRWGVNPQSLTDCLDAYTRAIMVEQKPHDPDLMRGFVNLLKVTT